MNALSRRISRFGAALALVAATAAHAGGPLSICYSGNPPVYNGVPIAYNPATVTLNYDLGANGTRSNAQMAAIVNNAIALWNNVPTATITMSRGADLSVDVTNTSTPNATILLGNFGDGINPIIYDTDGSIIDLILGPGASSSTLGFAGSAFFLAPTCRNAEGRAVINGAIPLDDTTMTVTIAHELGHLIGMDHTQLDNTQGLISTFGSSNYPLMYPIAFRDFASLHEDDEAAVTELYPGPTMAANYGQVSGTFTLADGVTPVRGANIWAQETTTNKLYSIVSDYLIQNSGFYRLRLPPGAYRLRAEAIDRSFTGGSSVGPYSEDLTGLSFQSPLYSGTTPMATVTLGGGTPTVFNISAGCSATLNWRINGTGTVSGNCTGAILPTTVALVSSPNPSDSGQMVTLTATVSGSGATPTGTVDFRDNGVSIPSCSAAPMTGGVASCFTTALTVGSHAITAIYSGNAGYNGSTSNTVTQVVEVPLIPGSTNVALASAGAVASASTTHPSYPLTAVNNGDRAGASSGAGPGFWADNTPGVFPDFVQIVFNGNKTIDRVVVYSVQDAYPNSIEPDNATAFSPNLYGLPAFTVETWNGSAWINAATVTGNTLVKRTVLFSATTTDRIRINVTAANTYSRIVEIEALGVAAGPSLATPTVSLASSVNPSSSGQSVTFTATVSGSSGTPTGTVDFRDAGVSLAGCSAVALSSGTATCTTSSLSVATHAITAAYSGNASYTAGTSAAVNQVVNSAASAVALVSSTNPSTSGQSVTFTATVSGSSGTPTGTVDFRDAGVSLAGCGAVALSSGTATCSTSALSVATHPISAVYSGNATYAGSTSSTVSQVVNAPAPPPGSSNVALASAGAVASASTSHPSFPLAAVNNGDRAGASSGAGPGFWADNTPGAFPDFVQIVFNGSKTIDRVVVYSVQDAYPNSVEPGDATSFSLYGLSAFTVETWNGSAWVNAATVTGNTLVKRTVNIASTTTDRIRINVTAANTYSRIVEIEAFGIDAGPPLAASAVALVSSTNPSTSGQSVTFTATVSGSSGTPTGTVDFRDAGVSLAGCGAVALSSGTATCSTSALSVATHPISAVYSGNATYAGSTSSTVSQVVNAPAPPPGSSNVALASAGAVASASTSHPSFPLAAVNNGDRAGASSGAGPGFWADNTPGAFPDFVQIVFNGSKTIDRVVVYSVQDAYPNSVEPGDATSFSLYGLSAFTVETWNGSAWVNAATVTGNTLVKRTVNIASTTTDRIRINVTAANTYSRIVEIEAFGIDAGPPLAASAVALVSSTNPSTSGQSVTFTATVSGSSGTPTGTVDFRDAGVSLAGCGAVALSSGTATCSTSALSVATHPISAVYSGNATYAGSTSSTVSQVVNAPAPPPGSSNVALASAGAVASASTSHPSFPLAAVNNGDRAGASSGAGPGFWADNTPGAFPDFVQIVFNGSKTIDRVVVYSVQDAYPNSVEPGDATSFSLYGLSAFTVETWNGSAWVNAATVTGNTLVKRTVNIASTTTDRIRINVTAANTYSRIVEIEAFGIDAGPPPPPPPPSSNVALASAGAVASASTSHPSYPLAAVNNGDRAGASSGAGPGFWADNTPGAFPDFVQIVFNGSKTIDRVVVYSVQDAYPNSVEPGDATPFSLYGLSAFTVETWNGSAWVNAATVTGNTLVKRTVNIASTTTDRIRINVTAANTYSRIVEIEAFGN